MIAPAAVGCKRLLAAPSSTGTPALTPTTYSNGQVASVGSPPRNNPWFRLVSRETGEISAAGVSQWS